MKITEIKNIVNKDYTHFGSFIIEPLNSGQGTTLGNSLRRILLSDLTSFGISGTRINNIKHEFADIEGVKEEILDIIFNLKQIKFVELKTYDKALTSLTGFLKIKGPCIVTASMLKFPKNTIRVLNPSEYICTITSKTELYVEIDIEKAKGYKLLEQLTYEKKFLNESNIHSKTLFFETVYSPIKKTNFKVSLIHDSLGNIKESLVLEILTNGTISPKRALFEALKLLLELISPLFLNILNENNIN